MATFTILPADERMEFVGKYSKLQDARLCTSWNDIPDSGYLICATPFTKDGISVNTTLPFRKINDFLRHLQPTHIVVGGGFPTEVITFFTENQIPYYDVLTSEELVQKNARLTAEGLLIPIMSKTNISACEWIPLITGYGKCGKEIANVLRLFTDEIYIYDIDENALRNAKRHNLNILSMETSSKINIIINTSPNNPFSDSQWAYFTNCSFVFQVASGVLKLPVILQERYIPCPAIPGTYAPKTAGTLIAKDICKHFHL